MTERVDIILVEPAEGGNLGSSARALKNMGFETFSMVNPQEADWRTARKMAVHATDLLESAKKFRSIEEAVADASWVVGVSGRPRTHPERKPPIDPEALVERLAGQSRTALLFGPERSGLTNEQLGKCQDILTLPTSDAYPSLNLAHAVLLVAWEIRRADLRGACRSDLREKVTAAEIAGFLQHAERTLEIIGYLDPQNPYLILDDLRKVISRADLDPRELAMLRGIFHRMDVWISKHGGPPTPNQLSSPRRRSG